MSLLVSVRLKEAKARNGNILTHEGAIGWLGYEDGYLQIYCSKRLAHPFEQPPRDVMSWSGFPWYHRIITGSEETHTHYTDKERLELCKRVIDAYGENEGYWPRQVEDVDYSALFDE